MFVGQNASASLFDTLITGNSADGFGGGLAGCSTGRIVEIKNDLHGAAIFDNKALGQSYAANSTKLEDMQYSDPSKNPEFWERDDRGRYYFQDYFTVLYTYFENAMLGGGSEHWDGTIDGERVNANDSVWQSSYISGLTAFPTEEDKHKAEDKARVYINGNQSAVHGGGIMCNGIMVIGANEGEIEIISALELTGTKKLTDGTNDLSMAEGQFSFTVYPQAAYQENHQHDDFCKDAAGRYICGVKKVETGLVKHEHDDSCYKESTDDAGGKKYILNCALGAVTTGKNDGDGNIIFDHLLTFDLQHDWPNETKPVEEKQYIYYIKEDDANEESKNVEIATDNTVYRLTVTVKRVNHGNVGISPIAKYVDDITGILLEKYDAVNKSWQTVNTSNGGHNELHAKKFSLDKDDNNPAFTNEKQNVTRIEVDKAWAGFTEKTPAQVQEEIDWVSVALFVKGKYAYCDTDDPTTGETIPRDGELTEFGRKYLSPKDDEYGGVWQASWESAELQKMIDLDGDGKGDKHLYEIEYEVREIDIQYSTNKEGYGDKPDNKDRIEPATWVFAPKYEYANDGTTAKVTVTNIPKTFGFSFTKVGDDDKPIYGAKFQIHSVDAKVDGQYNLSSYSKGYQMQFQQIPGGYTPWDGKTHTDNRTTDTLTTNIDGELKVSGLPEGYYLIREIEAPAGYRPVQDHIIHLGGAEPIAAQKVICLSTKKNEWDEDCGEFAAFPNFVPDLSLDNPNQNKKFDYVDDVLLWRMKDPEDKFELPETGGKGTTIFYVLGGILVLGCSVILISRKRVKK